MKAKGKADLIDFWCAKIGLDHSIIRKSKLTDRRINGLTTKVPQPSLIDAEGYTSLGALPLLLLDNFFELLLPVVVGSEFTLAFCALLHISGVWFQHACRLHRPMCIGTYGRRNVACFKVRKTCRRRLSTCFVTQKKCS